MIVPMKKVSIILLDSEKRASLTALKNLGVVHLGQLEALSEDVRKLERKRNDYEKAIQSLVVPPKADITARLLDENPDILIEKLLALKDRKRLAEEEMEKIVREKEKLIPWGDFDPAIIRELQAKKVFVYLCEGKPECYEKVSEKYSCILLFSSKTMIRFLLVSFDVSPENNAELEGVKIVSPPEKGLAEVIRAEEERKKEIAAIEEEILSAAQYKQELENAFLKLEDKLQFEIIHAGMALEGPVSYVTGFIPVPEIGSLKNLAAEKGWGLLIDDPADTDLVPTKVKNPKWIRIIEPIFDMLGTVPGYREFDISFFFLLFFCVFVSMIIGDAGYGSVLFVGAVLLLIKTAASKKPISPGIVLLLVLSICTIGWGSITGTWFSSRAIVETPFLSRLVIPSLYTFNPRSGDLVKYICFIIGTIHISIAHIWNFINQIKKKPFIKSLAQLGWLSLVLGLFYLVLNMVLDATKFPLPKFALYLIIGGVGFIIVFGKQEGKFFKGILQGVGGLLTTFLSSIGCFSDIISYIRLFAVGLATVAIADSFNQMASGGSGIVGIIGSVLILIFGHTLNLAMGALSVIVHGVRLNMLEFSGHLGMEWTGIHYKPFCPVKAKE